MWGQGPTFPCFPSCPFTSPFFGRPFVKQFALIYRTIVGLSVLSCPDLSVTLVYCGQTIGQDEAWHAGMPGPWPHCVRWGPRSPSPKGAHNCCGQMARWVKMPLGVKVGVDPSNIVLDGTQLPTQKGGRALPQFSAHVIMAKRLRGSRCHLIRR